VPELTSVAIYSLVLNCCTCYWLDATKIIIISEFPKQNAVFLCLIAKKQVVRFWGYEVMRFKVVSLQNLKTYKRSDLKT
jgi:hypothetical protein